MRLAVKILFGLILSVSITLMPFNSASFDERADLEETISCCKAEKSAEMDCHQMDDEHQNCDGDCSTSCCCVKTILKNENHIQVAVGTAPFKEEVLDTYSSKYKYLFNQYLDKPPIHSIS